MSILGFINCNTKDFFLNKNIFNLLSYIINSEFVSEDKNIFEVLFSKEEFKNLTHLDLSIYLALVRIGEYSKYLRSIHTSLSTIIYSVLNGKRFFKDSDIPSIQERLLDSTFYKENNIRNFEYIEYNQKYPFSSISNLVSFPFVNYGIDIFVYNKKISEGNSYFDDITLSKFTDTSSLFLDRDKKIFLSSMDTNEIIETIRVNFESDLVKNLCLHIILYDMTLLEFLKEQNNE